MRTIIGGITLVVGCLLFIYGAALDYKEKRKVLFFFISAAVCLALAALLLS